MTDLIEFLRARLDEDEQIAQQAAVMSAEWREDSSWLADLRDPLPSQRRAYGLPGEMTLVSYADARHIARYDPARVLAEVDAKRHILDAHATAYRDYRAAINGGMPSEARARVCDALMAVLRLLALPYAAHPDYREEWRP